MAASTCNDVVRRGLRAMGAVSAGKVPAGVDADSGMEYLQSLILDLPGLLKDARWTEVAVAAAYTANEGDRCTVTGSGAVTLPTSYYDCRTASNRPPQDLARVHILGSVANAGLWIWSATRGSWARVDALTPSTDLPFGEEDVQGLAMLLAVNIAAEYGAENELGQRNIAIANAQSKSFRSRLKRAAPDDPTRPDDDVPAYSPFDIWY